VVEHAPGVRHGGYAVDFRGEALDVLDRMDLLERIRALDTEMGDAAMVDAEGRQYATLPAAVFAGDLEVPKGELTRLLHTAAQHRAEYLFDDSITSVQQDPDGVSVTFENGPPHRFDLLVGADGLHSRTRALASGPDERFVRPLRIHTAIFSMPNYLGLHPTGQLYVSPGKAADMFADDAGGRARAALHFTAEELEYDRHHIGEQRRIVAERFAGEGWEIPRLLTEMRTAEDFWLDANAQVVMDTWTSGQVVLLGDAGYCGPHLGPRHLPGTDRRLRAGGELAQARGDHTTAFTAYENTMRPFVTEHQALGREGAERFFMPAPTQEVLDMLAANAPENTRTESVRLPDYTAR
jgi:2-polyprenyl-6-methoxyphenol hydroxylase-like FAD-dependent oxidoreductase